MTINEMLEIYPHLIPLMQGMPEEIELVVESFSENSIIVKKGDHIDKVMILAFGSFIIYNEYDTGELIYVGTDRVNTYGDIERASVIGDIELLSGIDHFVCSVSAKDDCQLVTMSPEAFITWFESDHTLAKEMAIRLAKRNCKQSREVGSIKYHSTDYRVLKHLLELSRDRLESEDCVTLKITRVQLAHTVGASERMIHHVISHMRKKGYLNVGYGYIRISKEQYQKIEDWIKNMT